MTSFKFDIAKMDDNYEKYLKSSNKVSESMKIISGSFASSDSYWKDNNNQIFVSQVKTDYYNYDEYILSLNNRYREILNFSRDLSYVCNKYGYKNPRFVKFNDSRYVDCVRYLNQIIEILNNDLIKLNLLKADIQNISNASINDKIMQVKKILNLVDTLKTDITGFCNSITSCINNSKYRRSKIDSKELVISSLAYDWKTY